MNVAMFSFADIDNYGDILFSHIFQMELQKRIPGVKVDFICPSAIQTEGINYKAYERSKLADYDALILAGGEVVHLFDDRTWRPIYRKNGQDILTSNPSDVVWDWVDIDGPYKAWISVGVRPFGEKYDAIKIENTVKSLDYISVRGVLSKKILENGVMEYNNSKIEITPDLGWLFPSYLNYRNASGKYYHKYVVAKREYLIFQINNIDEDDAETIARSLLNFQNKENIKVYLLPVIRPWEDVKYLKKISELSGNQLEVLPNNLGILEICDIILHSKYVLCSSLHAAITALAGGVPAALINKWSGTKLQDIFGHQYRIKALGHDLEKIDNLLCHLKNQSEKDIQTLQAYSRFMQLSLNSLFDSLVNQILRNGK